MKPRWILFAAVIAALLFCHPTEARLGDRIRANRASRTAGVAPGTGFPTCTGPNCGPGTGLSINANGGFEGALPATYFAQAGSAPTYAMAAPGQGWVVPVPSGVGGEISVGGLPPNRANQPGLQVTTPGVAVAVNGPPAVATAPALAGPQYGGAAPAIAGGGVPPNAPGLGFATSAAPAQPQAVPAAVPAEIEQASAIGEAIGQAIAKKLGIEIQVEAEKDSLETLVESLPTFRAQILAPDGSVIQQAELDFAKYTREEMGDNSPQ